MSKPEMPTRELVGLDHDRVADWLAAGIGARPPLRFERFGHGKSNLTFVVSDRDEQRWVVRRPPLGTLLAGAHDVTREHRILAALERTPVPTPRPLAFASAGQVIDVPLLAMEYIDGIVVQDRATAHALTPEHRHAVGLGMAATLGRIHAVDLESSSLASLASHSPYATRQLRRWSLQWERSRTRAVPAIDELAARLSEAIPEQRELTLVHGDFHLRNVITAPADGSVRAVIDWELSTLGDPLADLGGLLAYWPQTGEPATAINAATTLPGFPSREELAVEYARQTGRSLDALGFWKVLGLWKLAIIAEGVLRRVSATATPSTPFGVEQVDELVSRALATAAQENI